MILNRMKDLHESDGIWYQFEVNYNSKKYIVAFKFVNDNYQEKLLEKIKQTLDLIEFEKIKPVEPIRIII